MYLLPTKPKTLEIRKGLQLDIKKTFLIASTYLAEG